MRSTALPRLGGDARGPDPVARPLPGALRVEDLHRQPAGAPRSPPTRRGPAGWSDRQAARWQARAAASPRTWARSCALSRTTRIRRRPSGRGRPPLQVGRDLRRRRVEGVQETRSTWSGPHGIADRLESVQVDVELPVREAVGHPAGPRDRQCRFPDTGRSRSPRRRPRRRAGPFLQFGLPTHQRRRQRQLVRHDDRRRDVAGDGQLSRRVKLRQRCRVDERRSS